MSASMSAPQSRPCTAAQYGIWVAQQADPNPAAYLTAEAVLLEGPLDRGALLASIQEVLEAADTLHVRLRWDGQQLWQDSTARDSLPGVLDLSHEPDPEAAARQWMATRQAEGVDMATGPLHASVLIRLAPDRHLWFLMVHHAVLDGYGYTLIQQEVARRHAARQQGQPLPPPPAWSLDPVIEAEAQYRGSERLARSRAFWQGALAEVPAPAELPALPPGAADEGVHRFSWALPPVLQAQLSQRLARRQWDESAWWLAIAGLWLAGLARRRALCMGVPTMNRLGTPAAGIPCMAMNIVPLGLRMPEDGTLEELVAQAALQLRQMRPHGAYRYGWIRQDHGLLASGRGFFHQAVNLMPFEKALDFPGLRATVWPLSAGPVKDLNLSLLRQQGQWVLVVEAQAARHEAAKALSWAQSLWALVQACVAAPDDARLWSSACGRTGLQPLPPASVLTGPALPGRWPSPLALILAQARQSPSQPALVMGQATLSRGALAAWAQALAAIWQARGVQPGDEVALVLPHGPRAIASLLACWQLGAVAMPLDPQGPAARLAQLLGARRPVLVACEPGSSAEGLANQAGLATDLQAGPLSGREPSGSGESSASRGSTAPGRLDGLDHPGHPDGTKGPKGPIGGQQGRDGRAGPTQEARQGPGHALLDAAPGLLSWPDDHPACLLHTSGSTGQPKAVRLGHGALAQFVASTQTRYRMQPSDRLLQFAPLHFDASLEELLAALCHGATLVLRTPSMTESPQAFARSVAQAGITVLDLPTAYWHSLAQGLPAAAFAQLAGVRLCIIGGEAALPERAARWRDHLPGCELLNTYGPTETTIIVSWACLQPAPGGQADWQPGQAMPIGRPRPGLQLMVADAQGDPLPEGEEGELWIMGPALGLPPRDDDPSPQARYRQRPGGQGMAYATGDRAFCRDGLLHFRCRQDHEVKLSGHRVDLLAVEDQLSRLAGVTEAVVLAHPCPADGWQLEAVLACEHMASTWPAQVAAWREALQAWLPAAAVPGQFTACERLPRNANGKIDRKALMAQRTEERKRQQAAPAGGRHAEAPADEGSVPLETSVRQAWTALLGPVPLDERSHFFELGGKSIQAMQLSSMLGETLGREVPVSLLFQSPTLAAYCAALAQPAAYEPPVRQQPLAPVLTLHDPGLSDAPTWWCCHPADGLAWGYLRLGALMPGARWMGLQLDPERGCAEATFADWVAHELSRLRAHQPQGPYRLMGWSLGGALAQAMATELSRQGEDVAALVLLDSYPASAWAGQPLMDEDAVLRTMLMADGDHGTEGLATATLVQRLLRPGRAFAPLGEHGLRAWSRRLAHLVSLFRQAPTPRHDGPVDFFAARHPPHLGLDPACWAPHADLARWRVHALDCSHAGISDPRPMRLIAQALTLQESRPS